MSSTPDAKPLTTKEMAEIRKNQEYRDQGLLDCGDKDAQDATDLLHEVDRLNTEKKQVYAELFWLRQCADDILDALDKPGRRPDIHEYAVRFLRKRWPTLDGALRRLYVVRRGGTPS